MLAKLNQHVAVPTAAALRKHAHILIVLPRAKQLARAWPASDILEALLVRRRIKTRELG